MGYMTFGKLTGLSKFLTWNKLGSTNSERQVSISDGECGNDTVFCNAKAFIVGITSKEMFCK
jgi:hypothetical protein